MLAASGGLRRRTSASSDTTFGELIRFSKKMGNGSFGATRSILLVSGQPAPRRPERVVRNGERLVQNEKILFFMAFPTPCKQRPSTWHNGRIRQKTYQH